MHARRCVPPSACAGLLLNRLTPDACAGENLRNPLYDAGRYAPIETPMWIFHQNLHRDIFGTAPGLHHPLISSNHDFRTKKQ